MANKRNKNVVGDKAGFQKKPTTKNTKLQSKPEMPPVGAAPVKDNEAGHGVIFVKHLPNGFFEKQLGDFFGQFGEVTKVYVGRSKRTSRSRGYGYVKFRYNEVAQIAASSVNNYLLFGRLLKAHTLPERYSQIPRNGNKAFDSAGLNSDSYEKWLEKRVEDDNGFVGAPRIRQRRKRQTHAAKHALADLKQSGVDLPEIQECFVVLAYSEAAEKQLEKQMLVRKDADASDSGSEDEPEDDAYAALQSSDWVVVETDTGSSNTNEVKRRRAAIKLATEKAEKLRSGENTKPASNKAKRLRTPKMVEEDA